MGLLITRFAPTRGMIDAAGMSGSYVDPLTGRDFPKIQLLTVSQLLGGVAPTMPAAFSPYLDPEEFTGEAFSLPGID